MPAAVSVASIAAFTISSLEPSVRTMNKNMNEMIEIQNENMREISNAKRAVDKCGLLEGLSDSDSSDILSDSSCNNAGMRRRLKASRKPCRQRDHPALGRQSESVRRINEH